LEKRLWKHALNTSGWPFLPCPRCTGDLRILEGSLKSRVPRYWHSDHFDPNMPERFTMILQCVKSGCGEAVAVAGEVWADQDVTEENELEWVKTYKPFYMRPAPPIIGVPKRTPREVVTELNLSFELYWTDYSVCASRIRTSLDRLMDHFGVAKTRIQANQNPAKPGKRRMLDLSARIDKFARKINSNEHSEMLHALRHIGNLGTHSSKVSQPAVLDAYQLYEMALDGLFKDKGESAKDIIKRLKKHR
jgi:Domain of unknown function (DUF4145)